MEVIMKQKGKTIMTDTTRLGVMEITNFMNDTYHNDMKQDVINGLTASQKFIPSKYFYDAYGSHLFEKICCLPEYYLTRTELSILIQIKLRNAVPVIMDYFQQGDIVELGSGANWKIKTLLDTIPKNKLSNIRYIPVDISEAALKSASEELLKIYPGLKVFGIVTDFTKYMEMIPGGRDKLFVFFGSTIGNFNKNESDTFLKSITNSMMADDRFLLGIDMLKPKDILERAYNDSTGITSKFNKNILNVLNRELNANFNLDHFNHLAIFNGEKERIEMHLQANRKMLINIRDLELMVKLEKDETILTEICRKFSKDSVEQMAFDAGLSVTKWFSDSKGWFSLVEMAPQNA